MRSLLQMAISKPVRQQLVGHGRFFLHASRVLKAAHLEETDMKGLRRIDYQGAGLEISIVYSHVNGCVITLDTDENPFGDPLSTKSRKIEPIADRLRFWISQLGDLGTAECDFRQRTILRALFYGFREPLRKGRTQPDQHFIR